MFYLFAIIIITLVTFFTPGIFPGIIPSNDINSAFGRWIAK
jgi:hypothetical protein